MAKGTKDIPARVWTPINTADASAISFQNQGSDDILLDAKADTSTPSASDLLGAFRFAPTQGQTRMVLADVFIDVGSPVRLWAYSYEGTKVAYRHA